MMRSIALVIISTLIMSVGLVTYAVAGSAEREIRAFKKVTVVFTKNTAKCDFASTEPFERHLQQSLSKIGITEDKDSIVIAHLEVGAITFGALETQCVVNVILDFRTVLTAENIKTDNQRVRMAVNRLQSFPISLYENGAFAVGTTLYTVADDRNITQAEKKALDLVDRLVMRFDTDRKK